ncbi:M3 family metallopeptidase [Psychromonas ossibalaenae]|uniref:M3 family metallopeptidase n=1 Tax=Psychromonas ossibalaenae TaxID=444922 RepID=UPI00036E9720|nr:M3 family metallopeptidase [Psychromonas ossibalaenae]
MNPQHYFKQLNDNYLQLHRRKEDLFWSTYMGTSEDHSGFAAAEASLSAFIADPERITETRRQLQSLELLSEQNENLKQGLSGWLAFFEANAIESEQGRAQMTELIRTESELFAKRQNYLMYFENAQGEREQALLTVLGASIRTSDNESVRRSAHQALLNLEQWVLDNGYIELVKQRNTFAREQGFRNFFDYKVNKTEQMTPEQLFAILDDFELRTRARNESSLMELAKSKGQDAVAGHNFSYMYSGDAARQLDPYVPFSKSLRRWVQSFGRLNIDFSQADLTLDLLDRPGKYQNGFCHGPIPSFYNADKWQAAKVNFTSNAKPDQIGCGFDGINTLFHEGGHAAHFSNVKLNSPCFSQEFAPTSMAYAETQSMFCDSLLNDGDWLKKYAVNAQGQVIPDSVIRDLVEARQPFKAYQERSILVVPYFEWAVYSCDEQQLTAEHLTRLARQTEKRILGLEVSPRPLLAIPHLLSQESACSYQGYLLAHMAVYQTRAYFTNKFGYLSDNPQIGPLLAEHYWRPGNSISHDATLQSLTGEGFSASYLAEECNQSSEQAWAKEQQKISDALKRSQIEPLSLNASIKIVDGDKLIADNLVSDQQLCDDFESYIAQHYGSAC